jgi:hypothetical protein
LSFTLGWSSHKHKKLVGKIIVLGHIVYATWGVFIIQTRKLIQDLDELRQDTML